MQYEISDDVERVANKVIKDHLSDLGNKKIVYITQEKKDDKTGVAVAQMRKGKPIVADIKIIGGLNAFLASGVDRTDHNGPTPFPCLVVSRHAWNLLKPEQRKAAVHQQLCRLDYDIDTGKPSLVEYDVKEMSVIAKIYGAWNDDLATFLKVAKQHPLFEDLENQPATQPVEQSAATGNGKATKVVKPGNGPTVEKPPVETTKSGNGVRDLKQEVARRRGGARATK